MKSKSDELLMSDLAIVKSHSRLHVSDDNPYSESQFKTLKYCPDFPGEFGSLQDARAFCRPFFQWYNTEHRHSGIAMLTPDVVHHGRAELVIERRAVVLTEAYVRHPERFVRKPPVPKPLPREVWINPPKAGTASEVFSEDSSPGPSPLPEGPGERSTPASGSECQSTCSDGQSGGRDERKANALGATDAPVADQAITTHGVQPAEATVLCSLTTYK